MKSGLLFAVTLSMGLAGCQQSETPADAAADPAVTGNELPVETDESLVQGLVNPGYVEPPDWFKTSFLDIREDIDEATAAGRRLVLYFYQDGCPYCKKLLEVNFSSRAITEKAQRYFDVVAVNIWGDREVVDLDGEAVTEKAFSRALDVDFTPTLVFFDEQGTPVARLNGYYPPHQFETVLDYAGLHKESEATLRAYYQQREPTPVSGELHREAGYLQPPFDLSRPGSDKPLLVLFEQKECSECDELHGDIFQREESRRLLQGFDIALLDTWSSDPLFTPAGEETTSEDWARELGIQYLPTLVMFDAGGNEVFRTEAWLKAFHTQTALDYVLSGAYREEPNFQRYIEVRADALRAEGVEVDIMK
jgi:thioredoxin-related protein